MEKRTILIADDEIASIHALEKELKRIGYEVCSVGDGYAALSKAKIINPDLILLDLSLRGLHGLEVKNRLNQDEATANIPVIFLTEKASALERIKGFNLKADDFVAKPFDFVELLARIDSIATRRKQYEQLFMHDALTGLNNLHVFKKNFSAFFNVARRYKRALTIAVMDVDHFKTINDTYGHNIGDLVLKTLADAMKKVFREQDIIIRYGGDEFVILFPETDDKQASIAMDRLKSVVDALKIPANDAASTEISFSISVGIASYHDNLKKESELFELADKAMYSDKKKKKDEEKKREKTHGKKSA